MFIQNFRKFGIFKEIFENLIFQMKKSIFLILFTIENFRKFHNYLLFTQFSKILVFTPFFQKKNVSFLQTIFSKFFLIFFLNIIFYRKFSKISNFIIIYCLRNFLKFQFLLHFFFSKKRFLFYRQFSKLFYLIFFENF